MLVGIGLFSVITANVAAFFVEEDTASSTEEQNEELHERLVRMEALLVALAADRGLALDRTPRSAHSDAHDRTAHAKDAIP